jgi:hypothetical protein
MLDARTHLSMFQKEEARLFADRASTKPARQFWEGRG